jgi:hypothetical protein
MQSNLHRIAASPRPMGMNPLNVVVRLFVNIFGITQPAQESEAKAGRMIALMLAGVLALLCIVALVLRTAIAR